jgi:hypothetical protein
MFAPNAARETITYPQINDIGARFHSRLCDRDRGL